MSDATEAPTTEPSEAPAPSLSLLASEMFKGNYHGEVKSAPPPSEEVEHPQETAEPEPEEPTEPPLAAEDGTQEPQETESEEVPISSFSELLEHYELDPDWANSLELPVKVDGESKTARLSDLVKSYQMTEAAEKRLEEAKSKAKAVTQSLAERQEQVQAQFVTAAKLIEKTEALLNRESSKVNWDDLRVKDPAEYSAKKAELAERRQEIDNMKREAAQEYQSAVQANQQQAQAALMEHLAQEQQKLLAKVPEWADEAQAKAEKARLTAYLQDQGLSNDEIAQAYDHRLIVMARKAMLYDQTQGKAEPAKKKLAKVPKVLKPGAPKPPEQVNRERTNQLKQRLKKSGSLEDAFALLKASRG